MTFLWAPALGLLLVVPAGLIAVRAIERRRRDRLAGYGSLAAAGAADRRLGWRRLVGPGLVLVGFSAVLLAIARPQAVVSLPRLEGTVVLAFDVSGSMAATDFSPNRMEAAKAAARAFVERQPATVQVGVVAFSDSGVLVQTPTADQAQVIGAIERLAPQRGTSLAQGISASLQAIAAAENPTAGFYTNRTPDPSPSPVPPGSHDSAVIVLLTDGENNEQPDPLAAARTAADRGIRIDTVGIGSPAGTTLDIDGFRVHTQLDAALLGRIASTTGGTYYDADSQQHLDEIYQRLDESVVVKPQKTELTAIVAGVGLACLLLGGAASIGWLGRVP